VRTPGLHGRSRGRWVALALLVVTVAGAAVSAYLGRGYLVDSWWIWKLRSTDRTTRNLAAEKLAERMCLRAVPAMVRLIAEDPEEGIGRDGFRWSTGNPRPGDHDYIPVNRSATPLVLGLWNMGAEALPAINRAAGDLMEHDRMRWIVRNLLDRQVPLKRREEPHL